MLLLTILTFDPKQTVIPVAEAPTMPCPTCGGRGERMVWGWHDGKYDSCFPCPDCTDGRVPFVGLIAIAVPCPQCEGARTLPCPVFDDNCDHMHWCHGPCDGLGYLIVASAHVDALVPNIPVFAGGWQRPTSPFSLILSNVQPTSERCPKSWGASSYPPFTRQVCDACNAKGKCDPIPVAAGPAWREWPT